jgi:hypothetical protein
MGHRRKVVGLDAMAGSAMAMGGERRRGGGRWSVRLLCADVWNIIGRSTGGGGWGLSKSKARLDWTLYTTVVTHLVAHPVYRSEGVPPTVLCHQLNT